ncbi:hypothetical protein QCA50_008198 [Cerrena zonata]|uniref:Uncharacterized protein n=1 Tax=Cerrena zonata TaxID=2478898 RepID=A0AAW0GI80_9APHY
MGQYWTVFNLDKHETYICSGEKYGVGLSLGVFRELPGLLARPSGYKQIDENNLQRIIAKKLGLTQASYALGVHTLIFN